MKLKATLLITILALAAFAAGCGSKGASVSDVGNVASTATDSTGSTDESSDDSSSGKTVQPKVSGSLGSKPKISDASGEPPSDMVIKDIKKGSGKAAKDGDEVTVNYVGHNWSNNQEFDTSWGKEAFSFKLGEGQVIAGWDEGVKGMKVGGRRLLIIPPDKGYGAQSQGSIPANETLIFVVDLKKVS
ncbi:MAG: FKBP-type peptidyl-prolyl cis-trans isomerase [Solirubrobacterales bacterium]